MRKTAFIIVSLIFQAEMGHAQMALLDKIQSLLQKKDWAKAQEALVIANKSSTTAKDPRTYYLNAFLNKELFLLASGDRKDSLREKVLVNATKCTELDHSGTYVRQCEQLYSFALVNIFNEGIIYFNNQKYKEALLYLNDYAGRKQSKDEHWLDDRYYVATSYFHLQQMDSAILGFEFLKSHQYDNPLLYIDLANAYLSRQQSGKALAAIAEGRTRYQENFELEIAELNTLSVLNEMTVLEEKLAHFLSQHPDLIEVLLMAATVYGKQKTDALADTVYNVKIEQAYQAVLKLEPENFDANYNLGVHYYNRAVELINQQEFDIDVEELTRILEHSMLLFKQALPLLLKTYQTDKDNVQVLKALQAIYYNLNDKQQLSDINAALARVKI